MNLPGSATGNRAAESTAIATAESSAAPPYVQRPARPASDARSETVRRSEAKAEEPPQAASTAIYTLLVTADGRRRFSYAAPGVADLFGCTPEELAADGRCAFRRIPQDDVDRILAEHNAAALSLRPFRLDFRVLHPLRGERLVECQAVPIPQADGGHAWHGVAIDVTERRRVETAERRQIRLNDALFEQAVACFALLDRNGRFVRVNSSFAEAWGREFREFPGQSARDLFPGSPEAFAAWQDFLLQVVQTRKSVQSRGGPMRFTARRDDAGRYWDWIAQPLLDTRGDVELVFFMAIDVSERQRLVEARWRAERELHETDLRFRQVFEKTSDLIVLFDVTPESRFRIVALNPAAERASGRTAAEAQGRDFEEFEPELAPRVVPNFRRCIQTRAPIDVIEDLDFPPGRRSLLTKIIPLAEGDEPVRRFIIVARDVTDSRNAELRVRESERRFRSLAENTPDFIVRWDKDLRRSYVNPAYVRAVCVPEEELLGRALGEPYVGDADDRAAAAMNLLRTRIREVIERGTPGELETWWDFPGVGECAIHMRLVPEYDGEGQLVDVLSIGRDVTSLKHTERQLRELNTDLEGRIRERTAQLKAVNKELETFAYLVSHDLKTPLRGIDGYSRLLEDHHSAELTGEGRLFVRNVRSAATHMAELIDDLLAYSRMERQKLVPGPLAVADLVAAVVDEMKEQFAAHGLEGGPALRLAPDAATLHADRQGMLVVLRNLISNAVKFRRADAHPEVEIGTRVEQGRFVLWVRDNGIGFDMKFHERIFEIFQRLQRAEDYPGTGVGLALVRKAVQRMGGRVWAESDSATGSCFFVELPA